MTSLICELLQDLRDGLTVKEDCIEERVDCPWKRSAGRLRKDK